MQLGSRWTIEENEDGTGRFANTASDEPSDSDIVTFFNSNGSLDLAQYRWLSFRGGIPDTTGQWTISYLNINNREGSLHLSAADALFLRSELKKRIDQQSSTEGNDETSI